MLLENLEDEFFVNIEVVSYWYRMVHILHSKNFITYIILFQTTFFFIFRKLASFFHYVTIQDHSGTPNSRLFNALLLYNIAKICTEIHVFGKLPF